MYSESQPVYQKWAEWRTNLGGNQRNFIIRRGRKGSVCFPVEAIVWKQSGENPRATHNNRERPFLLPNEATLCIRPCC